MAKFKTEDLLNQLSEDVRRIKEAAEFFTTGEKTKMVYSPDPAKWSVVQVLEHMPFAMRYLAQPVLAILACISRIQMHPIKISIVRYS